MNEIKCEFCGVETENSQNVCNGPKCRERQRAKNLETSKALLALIKGEEQKAVKKIAKHVVQDISKSISVAKSTVCLDLIRHDYEPFLSAFGTSNVIIAVKDDELLLIEARCGYRTKTGSIRCNRPPKSVRDKHLIYAMVVDGREVFYDPKFT